MTPVQSVSTRYWPTPAVAFNGLSPSPSPSPSSASSSHPQDKERTPLVENEALPHLNSSTSLLKSRAAIASKSKELDSSEIDVAKRTRLARQPPPNPPHGGGVSGSDAEVVRLALWIQGIKPHKRRSLFLNLLLGFVLFALCAAHAIPSFSMAMGRLWIAVELPRIPHVWNEHYSNADSSRGRSQRIEMRFYRMQGERGLSCQLEDSGIIELLEHIKADWQRALVDVSFNRTFALEFQKGAPYQAAFDAYRNSEMHDASSWTTFVNGFIAPSLNRWEKHHLIVLVCRVYISRQGEIFVASSWCSLRRICGFQHHHSSLIFQVRAEDP